MRNMKRGFTLIELLITIILTVSGLMALMHMLGIAIFADSDLEYSLTSLNLANEKLEELKDSDYSLVTSATESSIPGFSWVDDRVVTVSEISTDLKDVQVDVRWTQKGGQQSVNLRTYIANY
ncbi:MAG: prepilin-type N-terminal cleavage/methylation domain-containing protein [Planctomycetota bacterium]